MDGGSGGILFILIVIGAGWLIWKIGALALFVLGCGFAIAGVMAGGGSLAILNSLVSVIMIIGGATLIGLGLILHELRIMSGSYDKKSDQPTKSLSARESKPRHPNPRATSPQKYPPKKPAPQTPPASTLDPKSGRW